MPRNGPVGMSTVRGKFFVVLLFRLLVLVGARGEIALLLRLHGEAAKVSEGRTAALRCLEGDLLSAILPLAA